METEKYIEQLKNCKSEHEFKELWNPDKFEWQYYSHDICQYCAEYIHIWWISDKFDWFYSYLLCEYCSDYFNIWWDPKKFNWCFSHILCLYCSEYFPIWWDPNKFNWFYSKYLQQYCSEYKYIWGKDYVKWKLKKEELYVY